MSFLNAVINKVKDEALREQLQERVDIIQHKIKFMDKVPVACLDAGNKVNYALEEVIVDAGGLLHDFIDTAKVVIYMEKGRTMLELMGIVPPLLGKTWPAVTYNRVYLMNGQDLDLDDPEDLVALLEDIAEMLHLGSFVFGNEGIDWLSFKTQ
jgi:iron complex transport system substrate-binding protein